MSFHKLMVDDDNHSLTAKTYADLTARDADTAWHIAANVNKLVRIDSPISYYILASTGPAGWVEHSSEDNNEFTELTDTPSSYAGQGLKIVRVNAGETALEFDSTLAADVVLNNTHRASDGKNHADVVLNNTHRASDGKNHADVVLNNTHRVSDGKNHADVVLNNTHRVSDGSDHSFIDQSVTIASNPTFNNLVLTGTLDLTSTTDAFLPNRLTTTQRNALTPAAGMEIFNTTLGTPEYYNGAAWVAPNGNVTGPVSATDNAIARFNGTDGSIIQNSLVTLDDLGVLAGITQLSVDNLRLDGNTLTVTDADGNVTVIGGGLGKAVIGVPTPVGITWVPQTDVPSKTWTGSTFDDNLFVLCSSNSSGTDLIRFSTDGIDWTAGTTPDEGSDSGNWVDLAFGNDIFVACSQSGAFDKIITSPDAVTWTRRVPATSTSWKAVAFGNGLFVTVSFGSTVGTSPDGITWTQRTGINKNWRSVTFGDGIFVAVAQSGTGDRIMTSPDGITWTSRTSVEDNTWTCVTYGKGLFVAVAGSGTNRVMTSPDGITWTARTAANAFDWRAVTFDGDLFVAVSFSGAERVMTSPDGITWTARTASDTNNWATVSGGNGMFIAAAQSGTTRAMSSGTVGKNKLLGGFDVENGLTIGGVPVAIKPSNRVLITKDSEWPTRFISGTHYLITAPITVTAGNESTISNAGGITVESTDRINNTVTYTGTTGTLFTADALTASIHFLKVKFFGNHSTSRLFNLTGSGFPDIFMDSCDIRNWGAVSELSGFGGGIAIGKIGGGGNDNGIFNVVDSVFFGVENSFFQNFSDTSSDFFTIDSLTARVAMTLTGVVAQPNERVFNINSSFTGEVIINTEFGTPQTKLFNAAGLDETSIYVDVNNATNQPDSTTSAELFLTGNTLVTNIPAVGALVEIARTPAWADDSEQMTVDDDGSVKYIGLSPVRVKLDANINLEPFTASKSISIRSVRIIPPPITVTFTNGTNLINETATALSDGDNISFRATAGTLPAEIRKDVVYFVVSKLTNSFQVAYTLGGAAISFTDDGTPTNTYKVATLHGSVPTNTITASSPRDLIPQATIPAVTDSVSFLVVRNNDDAVNIKVISGYQRYFE